jgi:hypothetical protein
MAPWYLIYDIETTSESEVADQWRQPDHLDGCQPLQ